MAKYAKENPGKITYTSNQVGSGNDITMERVAQQLGIKLNKIPAPSSEDQTASIAAGEGDWGLTQAPVALQAFQAGKVDVTFVTGNTVPAVWKDDPNVVSGEQAGLPPAPFGIMQGFLVPKEVSDAHREWLFKLIKAGPETDTHKKREQTVPRLTVRVLDNAEANQAKKRIREYVDPVVRSLGMHIDQQQ